MRFISSKYEKISKLLNLERPLIIFDCETTGLSISSDKIINLAYIKIWKDGLVKKDNILFNPEIRIEPEAIAVHGIRNRDLKDKPKFKERAQEIWEIFNDCYYSGFNISNFDLMILRRELIRVGLDFNYSVEDIIDTRKIFEHLSPRTVASAYHHYCGKELNDDRTAAGDAEANAEILLRQLEKYKEVRDFEFLKLLHEASDDLEQKTSSRKFYWVGGEAYFAFSKYKNKSLSQIKKKDRKFLEWILEADFSDDIKNIVRTSLEWEK